MKKLKISKKIKLETERLILRPVFYTDPKVLQKNINDFLVANFVGSPYPYKLKTAEEYIDDINKKWNKGGEFSFHIYTKNENRFIGGIGFEYKDYDNIIKNIGYWVTEKERGKGYMIEALKELIRFSFDNISVRKINAGVYSKNIDSKNLLEKCGFILEGIRKKDHILKSGEIVDVFLYAKFKK